MPTNHDHDAPPAQDPPAPLPPLGLLLDFGSVMTVSMFERHRRTETELGIAPGTLTWLGPIAPHTDPLWQAMQADRITERAYWAQRARELGELAGGHDWDMHALLSRIRQDDPNEAVRPPMRRLIRRAAAHGIKVGILSNELELFNGKHFLDRLDVRGEIAAIVDGTHTEILKPDPRAYALALDALTLPPERVLFVDDQFRNIAGALKAGLQIQFFDLRDVAGNIAAIAARLQLPPPAGEDRA